MKIKNVSDNRPKLTDAEVLAQAQQTLEQHFDLHAEGYVCTTMTLYQILLGVAANRGTLHSVCSELQEAPDAETVRLYLNEQLKVEDLPDLERRFNRALAAHWPKHLLRQGTVEVAIDFHDRAYYGKAEQAEALWVRGEAKDGTTRFYRVITAYLIYKGHRVTLALCFVLPDTKPVDALAALWQQLRWRGLRIGCLYLDKGFAGAPVCRYLQERQQPALIACPIRGKQGGTRALCQGRGSYCTEYTFNAGTAEACTANLAVCRVFTTARRTQRHKREAQWLLFIRIHLDWPPAVCRRVYRRRFGIETSYRQTNKMLGWTTSQNAAYRFFLLALGFVLLNLWVQLCWRYTQVARRGRRDRQVDLFRQARFIHFLQSALEHIYGRVTEFTAPAVPRL
jgi:putative transposase